MTSERISVGRDGGGREVVVRVEGEGPPVLLVHGIPGSAGAWDPVVPGLVEAGHRVLVPDLLGFGASDRPEAVEELYLGGQARALGALLDALGASPALVVGHDYGVPISMTLARRQSERVSGLVLAAGNLFTDTPIPLPLRSVRLPGVGGIAARLAMSGPALRLMLRFGAGSPRPALDPDVYLGDRRQQAAIRTIFSTSLRELESRYAEVEATLPDLDKPTVVLWGDRDPFFDLDQGVRVATAIPGAELMVAEGAGHFLPAERPGLFVEAVGQLSGRVRAGTRQGLGQA